MATGKQIETHQNVSGGGQLFAPNIQSDHISGPVSVSMANKTIVNYYGVDNAKKLTEAELDVLRETHKRKSRDELQHMIEYGEKGGSSVLLCQRFVHVSLLEVSKEDEKGNEDSQRFIELHRIFEPLPDQPLACKTIITRGIAGIGKSVLVQKLIYDWATDVALPDYDFIFKFPFHELSLLSTEETKISLPELVQRYYPHMESCGSILANESIRPMFIFDGLSDGQLDIDFNKSMECRDVSTPVTFSTLLNNLIKGKLVPSATVWITTRPGIRNKIPCLHITRTTEIVGFQDQEKEKYFRTRCNEDDLAERMIQVVKKQRSFFVMCSVPAFCSTLFSVLKAVLNSGADEVPQTLTEVYSKFLVHLIIYQQEKMEVATGNVRAQTLQDKQGSIFALGKLAFEKRSKDVSQTFSEEDFTRNNIDLTFICGGFCKEIKMDEGNSTYAFVHLAFQEYFAALYVLLSFYNHKENPFRKRHKLLEKPSYSQICKEACKNASKDKKGCQDFFLRFLCGLGTGKNHKILKGLLADDKPKDDSEKIVIFLKKILQTNIPPKQTINILHCLNDLNDSSAFEDTKAAFKTGTFKSGILSPAQCSALAFALEMSEENYQELDLSLYRLPSIGIQRLLLIANYFTGINLSGANIRDTGLKILSEVMKRPDCKLQHLKLGGNNLTSKSCEQLVEVLNVNQSIIFLDLSDNNIQDKGVSFLHKALSKDACALKILRIGGNKLTSSCSKDLTSLITESKTLAELDLSNNRIGEEGLKQLCETLKNEDCKLQKLGLNSIFAFDFGIMGTYEDDPGAENLCELLKDKKCTLQSLGLANNSFTVQSCAGLISALKVNQSLKELDLSSNNLEIKGIHSLCGVLSETRCQIHSLKVVNTKLTNACCETLCSVFKTNQTLTELDLSMNELGNDALDKLFSNSGASDYKLQKLGLSKIGLTDASSQHFKSTSASLKALVHLDLSHNKFTDKSIKDWKDFILDFKSLKTLRVEKNRFSTDGYKKLKGLENEENGLHVTVSKMEKYQ
ncbi:NACHT, LRR and PYD domains-containing protein 3-like [Rhinoraja longicauda]